MSLDSVCPPAEVFRQLFESAHPPQDSAALLAHLGGCAVCRKIVSTSFDREAVHPGFRSDVERTQAFRPGTLADGWSISSTRAETPNDLDLPSQLGHYAVVGLLGRGGMGHVVKALDAALNRFVAIKLLSPAIATHATARDRFRREAEAASRIDNDNVVAVYELAEANGTPYLVMQYVRGHDLSTRLQFGPEIQPDEALRITRQVATGLTAAHAQGVIHRDIKPQNILFECPDNQPVHPGGHWDRVKITDFGVARLDGLPGLTAPGFIPGTPEYMAPEQIDGRDADHRCDLYSLGVLLYRLLAGRLPFTARTTFQMMEQHRCVQPLPPSEYAAEAAPLDQLVLQLLQKKPADRIQTAAEFVQILDATDWSAGV